MNFPHFVDDPRIVENTLCGGRFAGIKVSDNADITSMLQRRIAISRIFRRQFLGQAHGGQIRCLDRIKSGNRKILTSVNEQKLDSLEPYGESPLSF